MTNPAGNPALSNVGWVDTLPSGLQVANTTVGGSCTNAAAATTVAAAGSSITVTNLQVPAGASTCTVTVNVTNKPQQSNASCTPVPAAFTNGSGNVTVSNVTNAVTDSCVTVLPLLPSMNKAFSPPSINVGGTTVLTFTVTNPAGNPALSNVGWVDTLPSGLQVANATVGGSCVNAAAATAVVAAGSSITVTNLQVPAGASTCTVTVNVTNKPQQSNASCTPSPAAFTNGSGNVTVSNVTNAVTDSCVVVNTFTLLGVTKVPNTSNPSVGGALSFTISVTNFGPSAADGTLLTDPVVAGFNASSVTCSTATNGAACPAAGAVTLGNLQGPGILLATLPAGSTITFLLNGTFTLSSGSLVNIATVTPLAGTAVVPVTAQATVTAPAPAPVASVEIPTVGWEALIALMMMLAGWGAISARRRRR